MSCTGNGATLVIGAGPGWSGKYTSIGPLPLSVPSLDISDLSTDGYMVRCRGDLIDIGEVDVEINWDQEDRPPIEGYPDENTLEYTIAITYPPPPGYSTGGIVQGTGWITNSSGATLENNAVQTGSFSIQFKGNDFAYTPAAP